MQDKDCGRKEVCKMGRCVPGNSGGCSSDYECLEGQICKGGMCVNPSPECMQDKDCGRKEVCKMGKCVPGNSGGCLEDWECEPGEKCCNKPGLDCQDGTCFNHGCFLNEDCRPGYCCTRQKCEPCTSGGCAEDGECGDGQCCIHEKKLPSWVPRGKTGRCAPCPFLPCQMNKRCGRDSDCQKWGECCSNSGICEGDIMMSWCGPCKGPPRCSTDKDCKVGDCCNAPPPRGDPNRASMCGPCTSKCKSNRDCERNPFADGKCCLISVSVSSHHKKCGKCPDPKTYDIIPKAILSFLFGILNSILSLFIPSSL